MARERVPAGPASPSPDAPDKTQLDRFKQTARELGCDETGEAFEKAFARAVPARPRPKKPAAGPQGS